MRVWYNERQENLGLVFLLWGSLGWRRRIVSSDSFVIFTAFFQLFLTSIPQAFSFLFQNERSLKWFVIVSSDAYWFLTIFQVKRIMNNVFYMLRNEFEADESYNGADIRAVVLKTIKVNFQQIFHFDVFRSMSGWNHEDFSPYQQ